MQQVRAAPLRVRLTLAPACVKPGCSDGCLRDPHPVMRSDAVEEDDTDLYAGLCDDGDIARRFQQQQLQEVRP